MTARNGSSAAPSTSTRTGTTPASVLRGMLNWTGRRTSPRGAMVKRCVRGEMSTAPESASESVPYSCVHVPMRA